MHSCRHALAPRGSILVLATLALLSGTGGAQGFIEPRHEIDGDDVTYWPCHSWFADEGRPLDVVGDVNGDGYDDLVFGVPRSGNGNCAYLHGSVAVVSGADGSTLWSVGGQIEYYPSWMLGWSVAGAGDVNADGLPDVIAGAPWARTAPGYYGRALVYSGADGSILHSLIGLDPGPQFGYSVSGIEDLNGDGHDEFIVSSVGSQPSSARVLVYSGADGTILHNITSSNAGAVGSEYFGYVVRDGGDVSGDGVHDILVGNPYARNSVDQLTGAVYVFSGASGSLLHDIAGIPDQHVGFGHQVDGIGDQNGDGMADFIAAGEEWFTTKVFSGRDGSILWSGGYAFTTSGTGDVNGDGIEDFLVGYPNYAYGANVRVVAGGTFVTLYSFLDPELAGVKFGSALSRAGDINRDGFADFMVGAGGIDRAFVYLGRPAPSQIRRIDGASSGDRLGQAVSGAGDVDGRGFADVIVGAPYDDTAAGTDAGSARVLSGFDGSEILACTGAAGDLLGGSVSGAGDVNRDGFADVIVGARFDDTAGSNAGAARVLSGRSGSTLFTFHGSAAEDCFGSVSEAGDVNGDGYDDVIVGGFRRDHAGMTDAGAATVYSGRDGSVLFEWFGAAAGDLFGYSVSGAGDVDADGRDDLIVGAYGSDVNGSASGSATVYSGFNGTALFTHHGVAAGDWLGVSVSGAGDVNKDGIDDVIVGASQSGAYPYAGYARVLSGPAGDLMYQLDPDHGLSADCCDGHHALGYSVSSAGDVNGDGYDDVIVGAHDSKVSGGFTVGFAMVYSGFDGGVLLYQFPGDEAHAAFGISVSGAGDVNGDGRDDVIVGAHLRDGAGLTDAGSAFVYSLGYRGNGPKTLPRVRVR